MAECGGDLLITGLDESAVDGVDVDLRVCFAGNVQKLRLSGQRINADQNQRINLTALFVGRKLLRGQMAVDSEEQDRHKVLVELIGMAVVFNSFSVVALNDVIRFTGGHLFAVIDNRNIGSVSGFQRIAQLDPPDIAVNQGAVTADVIVGDGKDFQPGGDRARQYQNQNQEDQESFTAFPGFRRAHKLAGIGRLFIWLVHR